jgi:predicted nucleic acid-binding protein
MKFIVSLLLFCCAALGLKAQDDKPAPPVVLGKNDTTKVYLTKLDGELVPWIVTKEVRIVDTRIFASEQDRLNYRRLRYNVMKVLPYARFAGERYRKLQRDLALTGDKKKQKELMKACEADVKNLFNKDIKNLTISQGEVLIKLVSRETGATSFALAKELKGGFNAFLFQSVARLFGHNLKETYDASEQRDIETILLEVGYVSSSN